MNDLLVNDPLPLRLDEEGTVRVGGTRVSLDTVVTAYRNGRRRSKSLSSTLSCAWRTCTASWVTPFATSNKWMHTWPIATKLPKRSSGKMKRDGLRMAFASG
jgi:hypothetical protein